MDNCKLKGRPMYVDWSEDRTKTTTKRQFKVMLRLAITIKLLREWDGLIIIQT